MEKFLYSSNSVVSECISPNDYENQIEDAVKFYISFENVEDDNADSEWILDELDTVFDEIIDIFNNEISDDSSNPYELAIINFRKNTKKSSYINYASSILEYYNTFSYIVISDFLQVKSSNKVKIWSFKELNTNIEFLFEYDVDADAYEVYPLDYYMENI